MFKKLALIISTLFFSFSLQAAKMDNVTSAQCLQQQLDKTRNHYKFNAMALTIIAPKISARPFNYVTGKTKKNHGREIRTSDYFQIGSNTKSFIAALMIKLQTDKYLSLDDPLSKWLPEYTNWSDVKIRNLLHNNSGIPSYTKSKAFLKLFEHNKKAQLTPKELIKYAYDEQSLFKPGQGWDYSNSNWILAGMIAERATHKSISNLLHHYFLSPIELNLTNTLYAPGLYDNVILERLVHGYDDEGIDTKKRNMSWAGTAGAILASNEDLAYWAYELFHGNALSPQELNIMEELVSVKTGQPLPKNSEGYGMGIGAKKVAAGLYWGHEGHTEGYHSIFAYFPEDDVTIAANAGGLKDSDFQAFLDEVMTIIRNNANSCNL